MELSSNVFTEGMRIPQKYTCHGLDINPPLTISTPPPGTKQLALLVEDPDVPLTLRADGLWVHWLLYQIAPTCREIPEGAHGIGVEGKNTGGKRGYSGPCPPDREHRYYFILYALDTPLSLPEGITKNELLSALQGHILATAQLMGRYGTNR